MNSVAKKIKKLKEGIGKIDGEAEKKRREMLQEIAILEAMPEIVAPVRVFVSKKKTHGVGPWITVGDEHGHGARVNLEDASKLSKAFPPIPASYYKDGSVSIMPQFYADDESNDKPNGNPATWEIAAVWIVRRFNRAEACWFTRLESGEIAKIKAVIPDEIANHYAKPSAKRLEFRGGYRYTDKQDNRIADCVYGDDGEALCSCLDYISYWTSETEPYHFVYYWHPEYNRRAVTLADLWNINQ